MSEPPSCVLCRRRRDGLVEALRHHFCAACLSAVGRFVLEGPRAVVSRIWRAGAQQASDIRTNPLAEEHESGSEAAAKVEYSVEEVFSEFTKGLEGVVKPGDAETHLDLAIAYVEMGVLEYAVAEAATALQHGASMLGGRTHEAVALLFGPGALKVRLDEALDGVRPLRFPD